MPTQTRKAIGDPQPSTFIGCLDCRVLEPAAQPTTRRGSPARAANTVFLREHFGHHTTRLERCELNLSSDQRWWNRNSMASFAVTDGQQLYVVTGSRSAASREILYRLRPGTLQPKELNLAVDEETIRRGLASALFPYRLRATKFRRFMAALQSTIRELSAVQLDPIFEAADDPSVGIVRMPDSAYAELDRLCASLFDPWELPRMQQFLLRDREQEGLLALRVRRELAALDA